MTIQFTKFSFNNQSNRSGNFVLEAPKGDSAIEFPFGPGSYLELSPNIANTDSARLLLSIVNGKSFTELVFEPQVKASYHGSSLPNFIVALRFELVDNVGNMSVDTQCELR
jgi:hypothetical protein